MSVVLQAEYKDSSVVEPPVGELPAWHAPLEQRLRRNLALAQSREVAICFSPEFRQGLTGASRVCLDLINHCALSAMVSVLGDMQKLAGFLAEVRLSDLPDYAPDPVLPSRIAQAARQANIHSAADSIFTALQNCMPTFWLSIQRNSALPKQEKARVATRILSNLAPHSNEQEADLHALNGMLLKTLRQPEWRGEFENVLSFANSDEMRHHALEMLQSN